MFQKMLKIILGVGVVYIFLFFVQDTSAQVGEYYSVMDRARERGRKKSAEAGPPVTSDYTPIYSQELGDSRPVAFKRLGKNQKIILDVLDLKDMDVTDVLKLISKKSGLNIVAGRNVTGKVTIYLNDVEVREALRIILETNDLAFVEEDGIVKVITDKEHELKYGQKFSDKTKTKIVPLRYINANDAMTILNQMRSIIGKIVVDTKSNTLVLVDTPDRLTNMEAILEGIDIPVKTEAISLGYVKAEDIAPKITEILTQNLGKVTFDKRSNRLIVSDTEYKLQEIKRLVTAFDVKQKEVSIEAKLIQVALSDEYQMGIDWEVLVNGYHNLNMGSTLDVLGGSDAAAGTQRGRIGIGTFAADNYTILLEALQTLGRTNILSSPRITVVNNEEAKILVGSSEPFVTSTTTTPASGASTTAESVNFIDVGVKLFVTPNIHNDGFVTMKVKPEVSSVTRFVTTSQSNTIPVKETSEAETTVTVKDGVTIVIGGLIKDEKIETRKRIPVVSNIPILGAAFRNRDDLTRKTELVIFLTPHIITGETGMTSRPNKSF